MTRKASPQFYNGQKFMHVSDLPGNQASMFSSWISRNSYVSSSLQEEKLIKYEVYDHWFELHFTTEKNLDDLI